MSDLVLPAVRPTAPVRDALVMVARAVRLSARTVDALIMSLALPTMLMLLFVYVFGGAMRAVDGYVTYVVPGVILLCVGFASAQTAVAVAQDIRGGVVNRLRSLDVSGTAWLTGHVVASMLRNAVATLVVFGVALAIGFRPHASLPEWLGTAGLLLAFMAAISWLAAAVGLLAGDPEAAAGFTFFVSFLPYPSSAFAPVSTMPSWLQGFAGHQPVSLVVEAVRGLLVGGPVATHAWSGIAWCAGILVASVIAAAVLFRARTAR